jgi:hypothetical protein
VSGGHNKSLANSHNSDRNSLEVSLAHTPVHDYHGSALAVHHTYADSGYLLEPAGLSPSLTTASDFNGFTTSCRRFGQISPTLEGKKPPRRDAVSRI